jgi:hypothetical protein
VQIACLLFVHANGQSTKPNVQPPGPPNNNRPLPIAPSAPVRVRERLFGATGTIPRGFGSYSLFLICDPQWLGKGREADLKSLYDKFMIFGGALGDKKAAIWFWKGDAPTSLFVGTAEHVDLNRNLNFCNAWHLTPANGPYIVVTSEYPDEDHLSLGMPKDSATLTLDHMNRDQIGTLLDGLSAGLTVNQSVSTPVQSQVVVPGSDAAPMWASLLAAIQGTINSFGCAWTFKVDAGPLKADLHSCRAQVNK